MNGFGRVPACVHDGRIVRLSNGDEYLSTIVWRYAQEHDRDQKSHA